ncbi:unnamed protein product [Calypogeia fissa]
MVGSIQPQWVCGPVPPGDGRHGQAIEMISGIYAVHLLDQQRTPKRWYESFRKIWHRGGHKRDFDKTYRGARPDDHDYYKEHYEPGRKASAHHVKAIKDEDAWRRRMEQKEHVDKILKRADEVEKRRKSFRDLARQEKEQRDLWSKAEKTVMKLVGMTHIHDEPPRARGMPQFDPQQIGKRGHLIPNKDPNVFHPEYTNLYKLDQYLKNLDSVKRGLLKHLTRRPGRVPHEELWTIVTPAVDPENPAAAAEAKQGIVDFERKLDGVIAARRARKPPPWVPDPNDLWGSAQVPAALHASTAADDDPDDYQKYGC